MNKEQWIAAIQDIIKSMDDYEEKLRTGSTTPSIQHILLAINKLQTSTQDTHANQILSEVRSNIKKPEPGTCSYMSTAQYFYAANSLLETLANYIQGKDNFGEQ